MPYTDFLEKARQIVAEHKAQYKGIYYMFGGGGGGTTQTVQKSDPWSGQQPYLEQTMQQAQNLYNNQGDWPQYYPSSTVQPFNSMEKGAINNLYDTGTNGTSALNSANDSLTKFNNGDYLSAGNPYFGQMAQSIASQVTPQIESQFTQGNAMNNPAAAYATSQGIASAIAPYAYQNYSDQLGNMVKTAALSPETQAATLQGQQVALGAGQAQQQQDQSQLGDTVNRYNYNQQLPFQMLNQYANSINGNYGGTSTLTQPYYSNSLGNALGTGLGALALAPSAISGASAAYAALPSMASLLAFL